MFNIFSVNGLKTLLEWISLIFQIVYYTFWFWMTFLK
jgi:hypothetical protein